MLNGKKSDKTKNGHRTTPQASLPKRNNQTNAREEGGKDQRRRLGETKRGKE